MQERVKILGVYVDTIRMDRLFHKMQTFMSQEAFHSIYFVGMNTVFLAEKDKEFVHFLEQCDFVIVAESTMEQEVYGDKKSLKPEGILLAQRYIERLLTRMSKNKSSLYLLGDDVEEIDRLSCWLSQRYPSIQCHKSCVEEATKEDAMDFIINDINSVAPDVMMSFMPGAKTMEFIQENRSRMNVKLCLLVGDAKEEILREQGIDIEIPKWMKQWHLEKIYRYVSQHFRFAYVISKKRLKNKMKKEQMEEKE